MIALKSRAWLVLIIVLLACQTAASSSAGAPAAPPTPGQPPLVPEAVRLSESPDQKGPWGLRGAAAPDYTAGPDDFGYTLDDSGAYTWVDAAVGGTDAGLSQGPWGAAVTSAINLGFVFPFYENQYSQVYISTAGAVGFAGSNLAGTYHIPVVPLDAPPNNYIAPYFAPLWINSGSYPGRVYYVRGGAAPNRYLAVEWLDAADSYGGKFTFEALLYEDGMVIFSYKSMVHGDSYRCGTAAAIENSAGDDGLAYRAAGCNYMNDASGKSVKFTRPPTSARVQISPKVQGRLTRPGTTESFKFQVRNIGDLGPDTYDLLPSATWLTRLYRDDGVTPLTDTDGDSTIDTGPLAQGAALTVVVKTEIPASAQIGDDSTAAITARSSRDASRSAATTIRSAVPASFAQAYYQGGDGAAKLYLAKAGGQAVRNITATSIDAYEPAVVETKAGDFIYIWMSNRCTTSSCERSASEIFYALLDRTGAILKTPTQLTDHSGASVYTWDSPPAIAQTADGRIGLIWSRDRYNASSEQHNTNLFLSILDASGNVLLAPTDVTNRQEWGAWNVPDVPRFYYPRIAALGANRFVLSWLQETYTDAGWIDDIYYAVRSSSGGSVTPAIRLTNDSAGYAEGYGDPSAASLRNSRAMIAYQSWGDGDLYFTVLNSDGEIVKSPTNLTGDGGGSWDEDADIAELSDGRIAVAWTGAPQKNPGESGWSASYYGNETLSGSPALTRTDPTIDFAWGAAAPDPAVGPDFFSVRWTGTIYAEGGKYLFSMGSDDGSRLWIDDQLVMDHWTACCETWDATVSLTPGTHAVRMEMHEHDGDAWVRLQWRALAAGASAIRYALLDAGYNRVIGPAQFFAPGIVYGSVYPSIAPDSAGHAVVTWRDAISPNRYLFYALIDSAGTVLTPATIFRTDESQPPDLETSSRGYGNTSYSWTPLNSADTFVTAAAQGNAAIGAYAQAAIAYGNNGGLLASGSVVEMNLDSRLTYDSDTSGITPIVAGQRIRWNVGDLAFLERREFTVYLRVGRSVTPGVTLPVTVNILSSVYEGNSADNSAAANLISAAPQGGPDDYGYTWDDHAPFQWMDATVGTKTAITGDENGGNLDIGFPFRLYEETHQSVYVSTNGLLVFGEEDAAASVLRIPLPSRPNRVVAPFWTDLIVSGDAAAIYTLGGGTTPNRYRVIQWHRVTQYRSPTTDIKTFEVVLRENGEILFQYLDLLGDRSQAVVGIEDRRGAVGLQYPRAPQAGTSILFMRPLPHARLAMFPLHQGSFAAAGQPASYTIPVVNTGDIGTDVYDISIVSPWTVQLFDAAGTVPLTDSNSDGRPDTGGVAPGATAKITVRVTAPPNAQVGQANTTSVTLRSALDPARAKTVNLQTAIPAAFAQVFTDAADGEAKLDLVRPAWEAPVRVVQEGAGNSQAVELPGGGFIYLWTTLHKEGAIWVQELWYALTNESGRTLRGPIKLTDHTGADVTTYDDPVVAVAPNGRIGIAWIRYLRNESSYLKNYNVYFALLDAAGSLIGAPVNLTNNAAWGSGAANSPTLAFPRMAATTDNRFVIGWASNHAEEGRAVDDIHYAVRDAFGNQVRAVTRLTNDTPGNEDGFVSASLAPLSGNRVFVAIQRGGNYGDIFGAILDSNGVLQTDLTNLVEDGGSQWDFEPDVVQFSDGRILLAWAGGTYPDYRIRFAVLSADGQRLSGPTTLLNPAALIGSRYVSVSADAQGRGVLTWTDGLTSYRPNLYYALVDSSGAVLTQPMVMRTSSAAWPAIATNLNGAGNTTYEHPATIKPGGAIIAVPLVIRQPTPTPSPFPDAPVLAPIPAPGANPQYEVNWPPAARASTYVVERGRDGAFTQPKVVCTGPDTRCIVKSEGIGEYYYRVKARNTAGDSAWSNVRSTPVRWEIEPNDQITDMGSESELVLGAEHYGTMAADADVDPAVDQGRDYFYFDVDAAGPIEIWLRNIPAGSDYNIFVRPDYDILLIVARSTEAGNQDEHIVFDNPMPGHRYYVQIINRDRVRSTQPYRLSLQ